MQEYQELRPDAELFARVWKRVMPDESLSRIEVHTSKVHEGQRNMAAQGTDGAAPCGQGERGLLAGVLEEMGAVRRGAEEILRRDPGAWPLSESVKNGAAQLRTAWFLLTGARWVPAARREPLGGKMENLLREQYLSEMRFSGLCRQTAEKLQGSDTAEIMEEQVRESDRRRRMLRHMLAGKR